ncbi:MAG TPA: hypothetical protein DD729_06430, partial [Rhodobacteraceae bacterium]|nr:hypothetical protein [Paracoccaceae bacterium]
AQWAAREPPQEESSQHPPDVRFQIVMPKPRNQVARIIRVGVFCHGCLILWGQIKALHILRVMRWQVRAGISIMAIN